MRLPIEKDKDAIILTKAFAMMSSPTGVTVLWTRK